MSANGSTEYLELQGQCGGVSPEAVVCSVTAIGLHDIFSNASRLSC